MNYRSLALKMIAVYRETMALRASPLKAARPDFSRGRYADSWWRAEYGKTGHADSLLPEASPFAREAKFRANEVPEDLLIIAQVDLILRRLQTQDLGSREFLGALESSLVGWDDADLIGQRLAVRDAEAVMEKVQTRREKERERLKAYRARVKSGRL